jgi:hypothetical protein
MQIEKILCELNYASDVVEKFKQEKIDVSVVVLLTDQELSDLGIKTVGDRAVLRKNCRGVIQGQQVSSEVRRVPRLSYSSPSGSLVTFSGSSSIPRKPKCKAKLALASERYEKKGRVSTAVFQKKLVVF